MKTNDLNDGLKAYLSYFMQIRLNTYLKLASHLWVYCQRLTVLLGTKKKEIVFPSTAISEEDCQHNLKRGFKLSDVDGNITISWS